LNQRSKLKQLQQEDLRELLRELNFMIKIRLLKLQT